MDRFTEVILDALSQRWSRISSFAASCVVAIWFGWSLSSGDYFESLSVLIISVIAYFGCEISARTPKDQSMHQHDAALAEEIKAKFNPEALHIMRQGEFSPSFSYEPFRSMEAFIYDWNGAEYEFEDSDLQKLQEEMKAAGRDLLHNINSQAEAVGRGDIVRYSIVPSDERATDWYSSDTFKKLSSVREDAIVLASSFDEFQRTLRKKQKKLRGGE